MNNTRRMNMFKKIILLCLFLGISLYSSAQINYEPRTRLNDGWEFLKQDLGSIWEAVRPVKAGDPESVPLWTKVNLPHCFNEEDAVDPDVNYYEGPGWYKKMLEVNNPYPDGRILLQFEGAGQKTEVYIFTQKVGSHVGGYDEWIVDITDAVKKFQQSDEAKRFGGKIPLSIRCDNTRDTEMIPSDLSDFNIYGGIYRYLNLVYAPALSFKDIYTNPSVDEKGKEGKLSINVDFLNFSNIANAKLDIKIYDPNGKIVKQESQTLNDFQSKNVLSVNIPKPTLWSPKNPNLYSCELTLSSSSGTITNKNKFGFRHFEFKEKGPFFLNGERFLLKGTHRHEDHAGLAAAMPEDLIIKEMEMMKEMGVNFIRLGHYQQSRIVLEQCDRLGFLVWEEIPWCRGGLGGDVYKDQARRMLTNMITQHRNHPSIILWGMGNENDWPNDFPEFDKEKIRAFMTELHNLSHSLDDSRLTCIRRCDFCKDIVDVYSPSIWAGWYRGIYTEYKKFSEEARDQVNHFLHVEWGGDSHAGRYAEIDYSDLNKVKAGDMSIFESIAKASKDNTWNETYVCDIIDWHLKEQETMPWLTGAAYWPFKDFSTPVRPDNPVPYVNQKGVVERDLTKKEAFYVFQSYWTDEPMIRIFGHSWETRWGKADEKKLIKVYSNCEQVELFLNGKSLGMKKRNSPDFPAAGLRWESLLQQGKNTLKAVGMKGKVKIEDEISFDYETRPFGKEAELKVSVTEADQDHVWVEAELIDSNGVLCLDSRQFICFESVGDGQLIKNQGTSTGSSKVQACNGRAKIKLAKNKGESVIAVKSEGLKTVFVTVK
ncbi:beta-galactosidase [Dysgonomonas alginatilytica]|uniref:Beta-galactosidase n=2 Tax=Dysgonomonas alginatilytica TaxID=1605892 RepID=A0A2V3PTP4_9BACT|nr:beta-galactosidase [Dysgonomonas alginatilytica]